MYAVYNRDCGHVLGVHNDRAAFEPMVERMAAVGRYSLRTRKATDEDLLSVLQQAKCERCEYPQAVNP